MAAPCEVFVKLDDFVRGDAGEQRRTWPCHIIVTWARALTIRSGKDPSWTCTSEAVQRTSFASKQLGDMDKADPLIFSDLHSKSIPPSQKNACPLQK
jgi:hypothetical protein